MNWVVIALITGWLAVIIFWLWVMSFQFLAEIRRLRTERAELNRLLAKEKLENKRLKTAVDDLGYALESRSSQSAPPGYVRVRKGEPDE